jgi:hypothetical protein
MNIIHVTNKNNNNKKIIKIISNSNINSKLEIYKIINIKDKENKLIKISNNK